MVFTHNLEPIQVGARDASVENSGGSEHQLAGFPSEEILVFHAVTRGGNTGDAGGMLDGFKMANPESKYIMQFDGDCEPLTNNFLKDITSLMDDHEDIGILMMFREGVCNNILPARLHIIDNHVLGEIDKATCCFIIRRELLERYDIWKTDASIGWGFAVSDAVKRDGLRILKTINIKVNHIDGTVLQAVKYPCYHRAADNKKTNYRQIMY